MEPRIQYAKTEDGVGISFWVVGEGEPALVNFGPIYFSHTEREWRIPEFRQFYELLARIGKTVRFDPRGTGLSAGETAEYSPETMLLDVDAVIRSLGVESCVLIAANTPCQTAIAYAARYPSRVSQLILVDPYHLRAVEEKAEVKALLGLLEADWNLFTETFASVGFGWPSGETARRVAAFFREAVTPEVFRRYVEEDRMFDVTSALAQVRAPTLIMHQRDAPFPTPDILAHFVAGIPSARLRILDGGWIGDPEGFNSAVVEFLDPDREIAIAAPASSRWSALQTIFFTDIESSTALRRRLGDARVQELVRAHNAIVRDALNDHGGREIKHTGDGIMASFPAASRALEAAVAVQRAVAAYVQDHPEAPLRVYIGLNAGEPIAEEQDLFGTSVDLARRICDHAEPGQILASNVVRELAAGKGFLFSGIGYVVPKGFEETMELYEVRWEP